MVVHMHGVRCPDAVNNYFLTHDAEVERIEPVQKLESGIIGNNRE